MSSSRQAQSSISIDKNVSRVSDCSKNALSTLDQINKLKHTLHLLTQFEKDNCLPLNTHCYPYRKQEYEDEPDRSFEQIAKDAS